eukprot:TRINITY_DN20829_c0_g1_i1.p1 TRINITY_DN20829_c0_g1~~TRINITY_DN20829_c0_g1_i1.p1  ORF type:complete len:499 (-),score=98.48 TRINITY_DN20829_c0_g1_i1:340-1836(-)
MPEASARVPGFAAPALSFEDVKRAVEKTSPNLRLEFDGDLSTGESGPGQKGRYLVARCAVKTGDVILSEIPLFHGNTDGTRSSKVYEESFLAALHDPSGALEEDANHFTGDCFHPGSPLMDCVAGVLLSIRNASRADEDKERAEAARLRLRQLGILHRAAVSEPVPEGCAQDIWGVLRPEFKALVSQDDICDILHILGSNRFNASNEDVALLFAGSMFEHSCTPNCFVGTWQNPHAPNDQPRTYRALRDVAEGDALSIDYLLLPDSYLPTVCRAEILSGWGFKCTCPRCTSLPELERSFVCAACGEHELCPRKKEGSEEESLSCRSCGHLAEADYTARCFAREALLQRDDEKDCDSVEKTASEEEGQTKALEEAAGLLGRFHHLVFQALWATVAQGIPEFPEDAGSWRQALETLIEGVSRLYADDRHPLLLELYHMGALLTQNNLELQRGFLDGEDTVLRRYYPEEAARQDAELLRLLQGNSTSGTTQSGPSDLTEMD